MKRLIYAIIIFVTTTASVSASQLDDKDSAIDDASTQIQSLKEDDWLLDDSIEEQIRYLHKKVGEGSEYFIGYYNHYDGDDTSDVLIHKEMSDRLFMSLFYYFQDRIEVENNEFRKDIDLYRMEDCIEKILEEEFSHITANPFLVLKKNNSDKSIFNYYLLSSEQINAIIKKIYNSYNSSEQ